MIAAGIDIGGTKTEAQIFDANWAMVARRRMPTPPDYAGLIKTVQDQINWADAQAGQMIAVGIGSAGVINPQTGLASAANLPISGHAFPAGLTRDVVFMNDCQAMALSEAVFGAGSDCRTVMALTLGTGVGGGIAIDRTVVQGPTGTGGEFGHMSAPAHLIAKYDLPIYQCGCRRKGCIETYIAGPGLARLAKQQTGLDLTAQQIATQRRDDMAQVWAIWCDLVADLLLRLTMTLDPDVIVLGGGLSKIEGLLADLDRATGAMQIAGFTTSPLALAQGGDTSGARGAAYAAWQAAIHD